MASRPKKEDVVAEQLSLAGAALASGDGEAALGALLAAWRKRRAPALSAAVVKLSKLLSVPVVSDDSDPKLRMLAFVERAHARRAADVGPLLDDCEAQLPVVQRHFALSRLKLLRTFEPDPRIGAFARWALEQQSRFKHEAAQVERALEGLAKLHADDADEPPNDPSLAKQIAAAEAQRGDTPLQPLEIFVAVAGGDNVPALLATVFADADNDELRQICADRLNELGDPRGEFIALQYRDLGGALDATGRKRMDALLKKHRDAWLGGMAPLVVKSGVRFLRGFPAAVDAKINRVFKRKQAMLLPEWNTVEELRFNDMSFVTAGMKCLRNVRFLDDDGVRDLAALAEPPRHLRALGLRVRELADPPPQQWTWLAVLARLPELERLELVCWDRFVFGEGAAEIERARDYQALARALAAVLPASCHTLALCLRVWHLADDAAMAWVASALDALPATLRAFELGNVTQGAYATFTRGPDGGFTHLSLSAPRIASLRELGAAPSLLKSVGPRLRQLVVRGAAARRREILQALRPLASRAVISEESADAPF